ncbi:MAG: 4Fe-4S cluster-binding domain-containing protein [Lachnospiraceae bacterium]|nr:4Fe-4S cluster-binding domain-containing protein [Lachnospiraceae bacterium]
MKWNNIGHEYDDVFEEYKRVLEKHNNRIVFFGAGNYGKKCLRRLHADFIIDAFVDNDKSKEGQYINEIKVISYEEYLKSDGYIVITVKNPENRKALIEQLLSDGKTESDFAEWDFFFDKIYPVLLLYMYEKVYVPVVELSLTERCTLKCKKCAHGCGYVPMNMADMGVDAAEQSIDTLFRHLDRVGNFYLIGGETLLYKNLPIVLEYAGNTYRDHMENLMVSTNGTIIPSDEILEIAKRFNVMFNVSNYTKANPNLTELRNKVIDRIVSFGCRCNQFEQDRDWMDYGFDFVDRKGNVDEMTRVFDGCDTLCREIRGSRFYYCIQARAVSENMHFNVSEDDYLDLDKLSGLEGKRIFFEYANGFSEKGYIDMCNYCNGADCKDYIIPAGEQMPR